MKSTVEGPKDVTLHLGDRTNMVYSSKARPGRDEGVIVETAMATKIGKIMQAIQETPTTSTPAQLDGVGPSGSLYCACGQQVSLHD